MATDVKIRIEDKILNEVRQMFEDIGHDVTLHMFTSKEHCLLCNETLALAEQVAEQSDRITLNHCECEDLESENAKKWKIARHPAIAIEGLAKGLVHFYGIPSGYEFGSLIESLILAGKDGHLDLDPQIVEELEKIDQPVHIQVFVTPTCPYCPRAVLAAIKFAMVNENITADCIEATEFIDLSNQYGVHGVPKTIINDVVEVVGAVPEQALLAKVKEALK
ncbi:MAG: thioredoxin family protein [Candidatus Heimdallarchaeota archaeon]